MPKLAGRAFAPPRQLSGKQSRPDHSNAISRLARGLKTSGWDSFRLRQSFERNKCGPRLLLCDLAFLRETGSGADEHSPEGPHARAQRRKAREVNGPLTCGRYAECALPRHDLAVDKVARTDPLNLRQSKCRAELSFSHKDPASKAVRSSERIFGKVVASFEALDTPQHFAKADFVPGELHRRASSFFRAAPISAARRFSFGSAVRYSRTTTLLGRLLVA